MSEPEMDDDQLDALLADWTTPPASGDLRERVVASARASARGARLAGWWAAAAGIGLAGAMAGALLAAVLAPMEASPASGSDGVYTAGATVFGDLDEGWES